MVSIPSNKASEQDYQTGNVAIEGSRTKRRTRQDFTIISNEILRDPALSKGGKLALIMLLSYCWFGRNNCFPGQERLAADLSKSVRTVRRYLTELQEKQYLKVVRRGLGKTNHYTLHLSANGTKLTASERTKVSCQERTKMTGESDEAKLTQVESDEAFSNSLGGIIEAIQSQTDCHIAGVTTRNTEENTGENTEGKGHVSNVSTAPTHCTNPSPPNRADNRTSEPPQTRVMPRRRPLTSNDEVTRKPEPPRMTAPPFTQADMDSRIRERIARERQRQQNPLDDIIPSSHQETLNRQFGGGAQTTSCKSRRQPVYEKLQIAVERISEELGDFKHVTSNITQAENIRKAANMNIDQFLSVLYEARTATKYAVTCGKLQKQDSTGQLCKMPYFFAVLREKAGVKKGRTI